MYEVIKEKENGNYENEIVERQQKRTLSIENTRIAVGEERRYGEAPQRKYREEEGGKKKKWNPSNTNKKNVENATNQTMGFVQCYLDDFAVLGRFLTVN